MIATFSQLDRLSRCTLPLALGDSRGPEEVSEYTKRGTAIHFFMEHLLVNGREFALRVMGDVHPDYREECEAIVLPKFLEDAKNSGWRIHIERGLGIELPAGGRMRGALCANRQEGYPAIYDFAGTADVILENFESQTPEVVVLDFKTGWKQVAPDSLQMLAAAFAFYDSRPRTWSKAKITTGIARISEDGCISIETKSVAYTELEKRLNEVLREIKYSLQFKRESGDWCRYCPSFNDCPLKRKELVAVATGSLQEQLGMAVVNAETAPTILQAVERAEVICETLKKELKAFAEKQEFKTHDGKIFGPYEHRQDKMRDGETLLWLMERFGPAVANAASKQVVTKTSVNDALRAVALSTGVAVSALQKDVLNQLKEAGAVESVKSTRVGKH